MNISMIPNNDIKTIHASQNDTQRKWEFTPFANGKALVSDLPMYIKSLKGNTLVWNQLVQNGNFASTSNWMQSGTVTFTVSNNKATVVCQQWRGIYQQVSAVSNHKYLMVATCKQSGTSTAQMIFREKDASQATSANTSADITNSETTLYILKQCESNTAYIQMIFQNNGADEKTIEIRNVMLFDLTQMGLDVTADQFRALFPIDYYQFDSGSLLSFNGTGIKTVGKNLLNTNVLRGTFTQSGVTFTKAGEGHYIANGTSTGTTWLNFNMTSNIVRNELPKGTYTFSCGTRRLRCYLYSSSDDSSYINGLNSVTITDSVVYGWRILMANAEVFDNEDVYLQMEQGSVATEFEPYTEITTNLPTLTYFPTGMKSAGSAYDELTPSKAITRIGAVDLGSLTWNYVSSLNRFDGTISDIKQITSEATVPNLVCSAYPTQSWNSHTDKCATMIKNVSRVCIVDSSYTSASAFKTAMSGVYLYYELATPTEEDVSLNLTYPIEDGGTEQLLPSGLMNGSVDLGSLAWSMDSYGNFFASISDMKAGVANVLPNVFCSAYPTIIYANRSSYTIPCITVVDGLSTIQARNTSYTSAPAFKSAMNGITLWYEKSDNTPTTSPIRMDVVEPNGDDSTESFTYKATDASFANGTYTMVCKNLEIPLTASKGKLTGTSVIGMTNEPGFFDAKLKMTDSDGVCYSTKFQLHVERKP